MAVLNAVIICRVMHSSAKARKEAAYRPEKIADGFVEANHPFLDDILAVGADEEIGTCFRRTKLRYLLIKYSWAISSPS